VSPLSAENSSSHSSRSVSCACKLHQYCFSYRQMEQAAAVTCASHNACTLTEVFLTLTEVFRTLTEVSPCLFLSCKANAMVKLAKTGHGPHSSKLVVICVVLLLFVLFYALFVCSRVLYYCHRVSTQLQLTNKSYHISHIV